MADTPKAQRAADTLISSLRERAKELNCLYEVEQILARLDFPLDESFQKVFEVIPPELQEPAETLIALLREKLKALQ